jgi:hypothetical protein
LSATIADFMIIGFGKKNFAKIGNSAAGHQKKRLNKAIMFFLYKSHFFLNSQRYYHYIFDRAPIFKALGKVSLSA